MRTNSGGMFPFADLSERKGMRTNGHKLNTERMKLISPLHPERGIRATRTKNQAADF